MAQTVNIFISSAFRNMHIYRDQMMYEVRPLVNQMLQSKKLDVHLNFIDLRWGVDERRADSESGMYSQILETCFRSLDKTDIFIGMYTEYRGTFVPHKEVDLLNEQYHWKLPYDNSLTELEYWYCKNVKTTPTKYCQVYFVEPQSLVSEVTEIGDFITVRGSTTKKLNDILARNICKSIEDELCKSDVTTSNDFSDFWVSRSEIINDIIWNLFIDSSSEDSKAESIKLTVLTGESGIGKSVLLSQLNDAIKKQQLLTPVYLSDASHVTALEDLMDFSFTVYDIEMPEKQLTLAEKIQYLRKNLSWYRIPCFIIDSIDDVSPEYFNQFLIELGDNFKVCHVITSTTKRVEKELKAYIYRQFEIEAFCKEELETAISLHEKNILKQFPDIIRQRLLGLENTVFAKPIIFQLILNDLSLLSAKDYVSILNSSHYSFQIEKIMLLRLQSYPMDIQGVISEICTRIAGSAGTDTDNVLIRQYITLILLSYMGVNEEYLSNVMGEQWKPLLFYQLRYSFRNIFVEKDHAINFSHRIFKVAFYKIISSDMINDTINRIISKKDILDDGMGFEKYRMCFLGGHYDKWYYLARTEDGWDYLTACLNEYCQLEHPLNKEYLLIPINWIEYMAELSQNNILKGQEYLEIVRKMYGFVNEVIETTSTSAFDSVINCCKHFVKSFDVFAKNCQDEQINTECLDIIKYFYQRVIGCAEKLSIHEKVNEFADAYEKLVSRDANTSESNLVSHKNTIEQEMWQLYDLAKFKLDTDMDREEIIAAFLKILKISQREGIVFPNFGQIVNFLLPVLSDASPVFDYIEFGIDYIEAKLNQNQGFSKDEVTFLIDVYHCKIMIEGHLGRIKENGDILKEYAIREYGYARALYERNPQEVQFVYTYSMACSDLTLICTFFSEYDKVKALNETTKKLKGYLHAKYPDVFLYAESYSGFLHNCAIYGNLYSDDERIRFIDESFETLSPYIGLDNVKASWTYLNHWQMIFNAAKEGKNSDEYQTNILVTIERHLTHLPHVLQVIFDSDQHNITFRKEALARVADIYNLYRPIADKKLLHLLASSIYDIAIQICDIEDSDSSYAFLSSTIKTLCVDQASNSDPQANLMDDMQLLKEYQKYIESKLKKEPNRLVLHSAMLTVPETEMLLMVGMLAGIEKMPRMAKLLFKMAWEKLDIHPAKIIIDSAHKMLGRMKVIQSMKGRVSKDTVEIAEMVLLHILQTEDDYTHEILMLIEELKKY